ncbi:MAG TPA: aminotransferase class V-fold PLP-dependent enzyme [Roseiflexaceae bacterium]|jgi:selenocysteine lyase/cysteine desulfurase|nr:aminotransferase class V-fold PLP-dependent enzyme [Roseiflexaceae bacterium]
MLDPTPFRELFPITRTHAFFNHAGVSPLNMRARDAMNAFNDRTMLEPLSAVFADVSQTILDLRQRFATLINARSVDEIVLMPNTATGLNTAALSLPLGAGDNVLILDGDYPANIYPWLNLARRGVLAKFVPPKDGGLDLNLLESRIDSHTQAIALSTVQFATGFRNDIVAAGKLAKERGLYFVVDGIQSLGALPMDVQAANIDFLACGSQKWLLGPLGGGFLYVRKELLDELVAGPYVGASSVVDAMNYLDYNFTLLPTAERFNIGTPPFPSYIGLHASVSLIQEAGIENVAQRILGLTDTLINDLGERGYRFSATTAPEHRSGIVIFETEQPEQTASYLAENGVVGIPRGKGVRIAPHFYNTEEEILRVGEVLDARAK